MKDAERARRRRPPRNETREQKAARLQFTEADLRPYIPPPVPTLEDMQKQWPEAQWIRDAIKRRDAALRETNES